MATTNYTTKTAALRATRANMRQVSVSKKIEIGKSGEGTTVSEDKVETTSLWISPDGKAESEKKDIRSIIADEVADARLTVGRDANKDWLVDDEVIVPVVNKLSFLGNYVNVVPGDNGELMLYIGENKSLPDMNKTTLTDLPSAGSSYTVYTDSTHNFALPVASGSSTNVSILKASGTSFGQSKAMAGKSVTNTATFTLSQTDSIWVRTTYDNGTPSAWGRIKLDKTRSNIAFTADTAAGEVGLPSGISATITNKLLTKNDASAGKIPGRCETSFSLKINYQTIANAKRGGIIKVEWGVGTYSPASTKEDEPATKTNTITVFCSEYKSPAVASLAVDSVTKKTTTVSGITYVTKDTEVTVSSGNITNTQYKTSNTDGKRLVVTAGGGSVTFKRDDAALEIVEGSKTTSGATYKITKQTFKTGTSNDKEISVKATSYGAVTGGSATAETKIANYWGDTSLWKTNDVTNTTGKLVEAWCAESYRYEDIAVSPVTAWNSAADVTTKTVTVDGTPTIGAVAQYGELMHPAQSVAGESRPATYVSATAKSSAASYIRKFEGIGVTTGFKVAGTNVGAAGIKVYWVNARNGNLVELTDGTSDANTVKTDSLEHKYVTTSETGTQNPVLVFVIPANSTTKIGCVTVSAL